MAPKNEQLTLLFFNNVGLFSDHYINNRLPLEKNIWDVDEKELQKKFENIKKIYERFRKSYTSPNEAQTEDDFIKPVLKELNLSFIVQTTIKKRGTRNFPDYALFAGEEEKIKAAPMMEEDENAFYSHALAVCDAKYWGRTLDIKDIDSRRDTFTNANPSFQIVNYLVGTNVDWGILTNGKIWRLYFQKAQSRSANYYEVDLENILTAFDPDTFRYFYLFFRRDAFVKDVNKKSFLEKVVSGSTQYAIEVGGRLKELVFEKIFVHLAQGFIHYRKTELDIKKETAETLKIIYEGTLTLLYRLLFLLYAETRDLLPVREEHGYYRYSLNNIRRRVAKIIDSNAVLSTVSDDLWNDLCGLFKIIDKGDPSLNVPTYNGGLFSSNNPGNEFFNNHKMADKWIAEAINLLTRQSDKDSEAKKFIDYKSLGVRQLGSIYEGLLEFHLKIADTDLMVIKEKNREVYRPLSVLKNERGNKVIRRGEIYLANDKSERKATGSYYTPDFIVKYIVKHAIYPVLKEKFKKTKNLFDDIDSILKKLKQARSSSSIKAYRGEYETKKKQAFGELFSIKVLDPAMGSGHFLVEAVDYITDHIIEFLDQCPENSVINEIENMRNTILDDLTSKNIHIDREKLTDTNLVKRMVMKRCIYGVDLNEMAVELAKLSLWLDSFTIGAPLSFLDHHLKCGNSLIWEHVDNVQEELQGTLFGSQFAGLLSATELMREVGELTDSTFNEVEESINKYNTASNFLKPFKGLLDLWVSEHFMNKGAKALLTHSGEIESLLGNKDKLTEKDKELVDKAEQLSQEKHFFQWELEFPEVFYEKNRMKNNSGFDVVIGNPPWERVKLQENEFFASRSAEIAYAPTGAERKKLIAGLSETDPVLREEYNKAKQNAELISKYFRHSDRYPLMSGGDINYYSIFAEFGMNMVNKNGVFGMVLPSGIATDKTSELFFQHIIESKRLATLLDFENREAWFNNVHRSFKYSLVIISRCREIAVSH